MGGRNLNGSASPPFMSDRTEKNLLNEWKVEANLPANFNSQVWRRLEQRQQASPGPALARWFEGLFMRRSAAAAYAGLAIMTGIVAGHIHGSAELREHSSRMEARYVQSIDPYAARTMP